MVCRCLAVTKRTEDGDVGVFVIDALVVQLALFCLVANFVVYKAFGGSNNKTSWTVSTVISIIAAFTISYPDKVLKGIVSVVLTSLVIGICFLVKTRRGHDGRSDT